MWFSSGSSPKPIPKPTMDRGLEQEICSLEDLGRKVPSISPPTSEAWVQINDAEDQGYARYEKLL
ncbi:hypothetical protein Hdeb2414_s0095g00791661 [Helianthus debilis subsp. tardiflorus]